MPKLPGQFERNRRVFFSGECDKYCRSFVWVRRATFLGRSMGTLIRFRSLLYRTLINVYINY